MKEYKYFIRGVSPFESYDEEITELHRQVDAIVSNVHGLSQPCHCDRPCKCTEMEKEGWEEVKRLQESVKKALYIK